MRTKETPKTSYDSFHSHEQPSAAPSDTLRNSLLTSGSSQEVIIPQNTFAIRLDSHTFSRSVLAELSAMVDGMREERLQGSDNWRESEPLSSLNGKMKLDRMDGKTSSNMTILYDRDTGKGVEGIYTPSAVIIHERLSVDDVRRLRENLPHGVPILDGETNELLDEVGRTEREMGREVNKIYHNLGDAALRASRISEGYSGSYGDFDDIVTHYTDEYRTTPYNPRRETVDDVWMNPDYFAGAGMYEPRRESSYTSTRGGETTVEEPAPLVPESEELRTYRDKEKREQVEVEAYAENHRRNVNKASDVIFDAAKDLYDVPDLSGLDDKQLRKVERKVQGKLHPDRGFDDGGDIGAFKEAGVLMDKIRAHNAAKTDESEAR